mgnify:FL=1
MDMSKRFYVSKKEVKYNLSVSASLSVMLIGRHFNVNTEDNSDMTNSI